jgi:hypothetical protein
MSDSQIKARFLEILNPSSTSTSTTHQSSARIKTSSDISDQAKRLRRLVLTAGIPDEASSNVISHDFLALEPHCADMITIVILIL